MFLLRQLAAFVLLLALCDSPGGAQEHTATLAGAVRGRKATLSQVTVRLLPENTNHALASTLTAHNGGLSFAGLPCGGSYTMAFSRPGWKPRRIDHLQLHCDSTVQLMVVLYLGVVAACYDGLPFGRLLFINGFTQGPFFVRAQPVGHPGGFQTQLNATLDARIARDFALPRGVLSACFDVFNLLNANSSTLESDLSGPAFLTRVPLAVETPRTARLGVQWKF
jgi:hypothetical protein